MPIIINEPLQSVEEIDKPNPIFPTDSDEASTTNPISRYNFQPERHNAGLHSTRLNQIVEDKLIILYP